MGERIRNRCADRQGEGYIDVAIGVLCLMLVVALAMTIFPVLMKKQQLDYFANEIVRQAEIRHDMMLALYRSQEADNLLATARCLAQSTENILQGLLLS